MTSLWSNPYYGNEPHEWEHSRTTPKRVFVRGTLGRHEDEFDRTYPALPEGAIATKKGVSDRLFLFESRAACLRYMAKRARGRAYRLEREVADLRENALKWLAEAEGI